VVSPSMQAVRGTDDSRGMAGCALPVVSGQERQADGATQKPRRNAGGSVDLPGDDNVTVALLVVSLALQ
jgi:hypothetical protein